MKKINLVVLMAFIMSTLFISSCKDDAEGGNPAKDCVLKQISDSDGFVTTYTYADDKLVKVHEKDSFSDLTETITYTDGKISEITNTDSEKWVVIYKDGKVDRVDYFDNNSLEGYSNIAYNSDGKVRAIDVYEKDNTEDFIIENYAFTWNGDNLAKMTFLYNDDDNPEILEAKEVSNFTSFDDKKNPLFGDYSWLIDHSEALSYCKNNVTASSIIIEGVTIPVVISYEYGGNGEVTKANYSTSILGQEFTTIVNFAYTCK